MLYSPLSILENLGLVGGSILLFCAPFIVSFYVRHHQQIRDQKPGFNQFIERFFASPELDWLVFAWAAFEALVWFVIPEFLLFLIIFMKVRHKRQLLIYDISGTIVGTLVGLLIHLPKSSLLQVPFVYPNMFTKVDAWFHGMGLWGLINQPFSGVPYKVFLYEAPTFHFNVLLFVLLALLLRVSRYALLYGVFRLLYPALHQFVYRHYALLISIAIVLFTLLLMKVSSLY